MASTDCRRDTDGLRAVAVLGVGVFHAEVLGLRGGFVAVDVFFVISGYLITTILVREHASSGRISILDFCARRLRRLLPAHYAVLVGTTLAVLIREAAADVRRYAVPLLAALTFLSNVCFWRTSGYFSDNASVTPLLHTRSLAVEEHFYLIWPVLLIVLLAWGLTTEIEIIWLKMRQAVSRVCVRIAQASKSMFRIPGRRAKAIYRNATNLSFSQIIVWQA